MIFIRRYDPIYTISKKFTRYRLKVWKQRDTLKRKIRKFINNKIYQQRTKIDKNHFNFTSEQNFDIISSTSKLLNDSVVYFIQTQKKKKKLNIREIYSPRKNISYLSFTSRKARFNRKL